MKLQLSLGLAIAISFGCSHTPETNSPTADPQDTTIEVDKASSWDDTARATCLRTAHEHMKMMHAATKERDISGLLDRTYPIWEAMGKTRADMEAVLADQLPPVDETTGMSFNTAMPTQVFQVDSETQTVVHVELLVDGVPTIASDNIGSRQMIVRRGDFSASATEWKAPYKKYFQTSPRNCHSARRR